MADIFIRDRHSVLACPVCAKAGRGRGVVQSYYHPNESYCLYCVSCGWKGNHETVQSYMFPCRIYQTVEIDLSVVENMSAQAEELDERPCLKPLGAKYGQVYEYTIGAANGDTTLDGETRVFHTLKFLVAQGWLFPAIYKVEIDV